MWTSTPPQDGLLVLEDGSAYAGSIVSPGTRFGEVVFNTSMTGYQEILTDPSYRGQIVVMTQPHIGNYGTSANLDESSRPWVEAFVAHQFTARHSGSGEVSLPGYLRQHGIPSLHEIDTRSLVRRLRERGAMRGVVTSERSEVGALVEEVRDFPRMEGRALVDEVTCAVPYSLLPDGAPRCRLAVYDYGIKTNILRSLLARGAALEVLPARTPASVCRDLGVDGVVLSNGPGDPEPLRPIIDVVSGLVEVELPVLGICLGHQLLGLALGGKTLKLKFGHHGGNQPVKDLATGAVAITSQNHGFAVDGDSLPSGVRVTEVNLNDGTVEGLAVEGRPVFSVQYHPEAAPGPHDASPLFSRFLERVSPRRGESSRATHDPTAGQ
jgi:carbamoyl-phosphate synthase small subunit